MRWRKSAESTHQPERPANPLQIGPALQMAALFQLVLFAVGATARAFGGSGLLISGAVLGLTDVDALTISMTTTPTAAGEPAIAAKAIAIGILSNCLLKTALVAVLGAPTFRRTTAVLLAGMAAVIAVALAVLR